MKKAFLLAGLMSVAPLAAHASAYSNSYSSDIYTNDIKVVVGGNVSRDQSNLGELINRDPAVAATGAHLDGTDTGTGVNVYVGMRFNPYMTVRAGYRRFGDYNSDITAGGLIVGHVKMEADGPYFAFDGTLPLNDRFSIGATLGFQNWNGDYKVYGGGVSSSQSDKGHHAFYGVRAAWKINETASLVASYDYYTFDVTDQSKNLDYNTVALGLEFAF